MLVNFINTILFAINTEATLAVIGVSRVEIPTLGSIVVFWALNYNALFTGNYVWNRCADRCQRSSFPRPFSSPRRGSTRPSPTSVVFYDPAQECCCQSYRTGRGTINAVDGVTLDIPDNCILGVAGESGCGKSTLMKVILWGREFGRWRWPKAKSIMAFPMKKGEPITSANIQRQMVQDDLLYPAELDELAQPGRPHRQAVHRLSRHRFRQGSAFSKRVRAFIGKLDLPVETLDAYPHQLSGGHASARDDRHGHVLPAASDPGGRNRRRPWMWWCKRKSFCCSWSCREQMGNTIMLVFSRHGRALSGHASHADSCMRPKAVEYAASETLFAAPASSLHPHADHAPCRPLATTGRVRAFRAVRPVFGGNLRGCRFADRCPLATDRCRSEEPALLEHKPGHFAACHYAGTELPEEKALS